MNAHVIRHLDRNCRSAGQAANASGSEWDIERRVRPSHAGEAVDVAIGADGQFARQARRADRMPVRHSLLRSLRSVLSPGRPAGGVIGS